MERLWFLIDNKPPMLHPFVDENAGNVTVNGTCYLISSKTILVNGNSKRVLADVKRRTSKLHNRRWRFSSQKVQGRVRDQIACPLARDLPATFLFLGIGPEAGLCSKAIYPCRSDRMLSSPLRLTAATMCCCTQEDQGLLGG